MKLFDMPSEARVTEMSYPTRVIFGAGALARLPEELSRLGVRRVFLVTDGGVAKAGLAKKVAEVLGGAKVGNEVWAGAAVHDQDVARGAERFKAGGFDGLVAVGGGTAIDAAKLVALVAVSPGGLSRFGAGAPIPALAPLVAVPTIAGAGAEVSRYAVAALEGGRRAVLSSGQLMPAVAICDAELTYGLPPAQTAVAGMEAFARCVEGYLANGLHPLADALAIDGVIRVARSLPAAVQEPDDLAARSDLMVAAIEGAMASEKGAGVCRALAHGLAARSGVPHGLGSTVLLPSVVEFNRGATTARLARVAVAMGDNSISRQEVLAGNAIDRVRRLSKQLGIAARLRDVGVREQDLEAVAQTALEDAAHLANPRRCSLEDLQGILNDAW